MSDLLKKNKKQLCGCCCEGKSSSLFFLNKNISFYTMYIYSVLCVGKKESKKILSSFLSPQKKVSLSSIHYIYIWWQYHIYTFSVLYIYEGSCLYFLFFSISCLPVYLFTIDNGLQTMVAAAFFLFLCNLCKIRLLFVVFPL